MKKVLLVSFLLTVSAISKAQTTDESRVKTMLKTFYTAYMTAFSSDTGNSLLQLRRKYCTAKCERLFKKLVEETDADPIIKGQDSNAKYAQTLIIKKDNNRANSYTVSYSYDDYDEKGKLKRETATIHLFVLKVKGVFKIDSIL
jgi:hypothetical protein